MQNEITEGTKVEAITTVQDDYDTGRIVEISDDGKSAYVAWNGGMCATWTPVTEIRPI